MASKYLEASGAITTSGYEARVLGVILTNGAAVGDASGETAVFKTGGTGGTQVGPIITLAGGQTVQLDLAGYNVIADYLTLGTNVNAFVRYMKPNKAT
jgi:hypothetical protein